VYFVVGSYQVKFELSAEEEIGAFTNPNFSLFTSICYKGHLDCKIKWKTSIIIKSAPLYFAPRAVPGCGSGGLTLDIAFALISFC